MSKDKSTLIQVRVTTTLWNRFDALIQRLKKAGLIDSHETRSSIIKDFIAMYLTMEEARLKQFGKDSEYYKEEEKKLERI